jgi:hypothetical protein
MIYPEHYSEQDKKIYDDFYSVCVSQVGQPKDYELYMFDINSKMEVSRRKGEVYVLTDEEQDQMAKIWTQYGQPYI